MQMHTEKHCFQVVRRLIPILACLLLPLSAMYADETRTASLPDLESLLEAGPEAVELTSEEQQLYDMIMEYRREHGLPEIPLSRSLTFVAQLHARDTAYNEFAPGCNLHSWSDNGPWQGGCYTSDHANAALMWEKPAELTNYSGHGYEISHFNSRGATAVSSLSGWQSSPGHDRVIRSAGQWSRAEWKAIGIGIYKTEAHVWFGRETDPLDIQAGAAQQRDIGTDDPFFVSDEDLEYLRNQDIIVYGRPELCGLTIAMMRDFDNRDIPFQIVDVDADPEYNREMWRKIRGSNQEQIPERITFPIVDVGGRISISNTRTAAVLAAIREQPIPENSPQPQQGTPGSRSYAPEARNSGLGLGIGGGFLMRQDSSEIYYVNHRLHLTGHLGWRLGNPNSRRPLLRTMLQIKIGAENASAGEATSYVPFGQSTAGFVVGDWFRLSAGLDITGGSAGNTTAGNGTGNLTFARVIELARTTFSRGRLTEAFLSYQHSLNAELTDFHGGIWQIGISLGLFGR